MIGTVAVCEAHVPFVHGGAELHVAAPESESLGAAGCERARAITWDGVVERLVEVGSR
jgi:hypothetical protein